MLLLPLFMHTSIVVTGFLSKPNNKISFTSTKRYSFNPYDTDNIVKKMLRLIPGNDKTTVDNDSNADYNTDKDDGKSPEIKKKKRKNKVSNTLILSN